MLLNQAPVGRSSESRVGKLAGLLTVLPQKTEHVIGLHGTATVSEAMPASLVSIL